MPRKRHRNPDVAKRNRVASYTRHKARLQAKEKFDSGITREREIGVDPIFWHGSSARRDWARPQWLKMAKQYDMETPL